MMTYSIDGALYAEMIRNGAVALCNNVQTVNELNVFPIPDGDTGVNMARTIEGGVATLSGEERSVGEVADSVAKGMLLAARGNSGVILSQFFEGLRKGFDGKRDAGVREFKAAFALGVEQAYESVVTPTEGTILTVMRESTEAAKAVADDDSLERYFEAFIEEMYDSLDRTPELLPVLKEAGVIDSGGAGFTYIIDGMYGAIKGERVSSDEARAHEELAAATDGGSDKFTADSKMEFGYCTEAIVQLMRDKTDVDGYDVATLVKFLEDMGGDSIVAFKTDTRVKLHVHTFEPDKVMAYCLTIGELVSVKVENMSIQHTGSVVRNRFERRTPRNERKKYACVTVADGDGLIEQFRSLGADYVIDGKQTMNPSTQEFISAFDAVNADVIFVMPNNSNIILAVNQAAEMYEGSRVVIVGSKTLAEGYAAMSMLDYSQGGVDEIKGAFDEAIAGVTTGLVSYSIRDCRLGGRDIKKGEFLGFADKTPVSSGKDMTAVACELLDATVTADTAVVVAMRGKDAPEQSAVAIAEHMKKTAPHVEFYEFDGGQDVYSYIFVVE